jgi:hypothetical protein
LDWSFGGQRIRVLVDRFATEAPCAGQLLRESDRAGFGGSFAALEKIRSRWMLLLRRFAQDDFRFF